MARTVLITGAGSGIGLGTALVLAERGFDVYAAVYDLSQEPDVRKAAAERGVRLEVLPLDVTDPDSIERAVARIVEERGRIDVVVNSAGLGLRGFFEDLDDAEIRTLYDVNVFGIMNVTRAVLPHMRRARRGHLLMVTSSGGRNAVMSLSGYCSGKFAIEGFGEALSHEVAPFGIHVSLIEPGLVMTPHFTVHRGRARRAMEPDSPYFDWFARHEAMVDGILRKQRITPVDVGEVIHDALTAKRPALRYVVGWRAKLLIGLHKILPGDLFERIYRWQMNRAIIAPSDGAKKLNELELPGRESTDYLGVRAGPQGGS